MNAEDILKYGHYTVLRTIENMAEADWLAEGVCGWWSVKDIIAHLASYEQMLVDVFNEILSGEQGSTLMLMINSGPETFNDMEVGKRQQANVAEVLAEYEETQAQTMHLIQQISLVKRREVGALTWYGSEYDLEDYLVYTFYGHKREHSAQIAVFRDSLKSN
jgi:hypothetical protein